MLWRELQLLLLRRTFPAPGLSFHPAHGSLCCLCLGIPETCQTYSSMWGLFRWDLMKGRILLILKAAIVCDTDECDVTLKYELTTSWENQSRKNLALKPHAVHGLYFAASCKWSLSSRDDALGDGAQWHLQSWAWRPMDPRSPRRGVPGPCAHLPTGSDSGTSWSPPDASTEQTSPAGLAAWDSQGQPWAVDF